MKVQQFVAMMKRASRYGFAKQSKAIEQAGKDFQAAQAGNFDRAEDANGRPWKEHAPLTIALHGPHPLLILSGAMKRAATGGAGSVIKVKAGAKESTVVVSISNSTIPYAWKHQHGAGRIPRRQFFYLAREAREPLRVRFLAAVTKQIKADLKWP